MTLCRPDSEPSVADAVKQAFNDPSTADVKFVKGGDQVHVHKAVLKAEVVFSLVFVHIRVRNFIPG
jgi:hypothetical protein